MDNRPIGVFDSGLGGLTAVHSLWRILPEEYEMYREKIMSYGIPIHQAVEVNI